MSFIPKIDSTGRTPYSRNASISSAQPGTALKIFRMFGLALGGVALLTTYIQFRGSRAKANNEYTRWQKATLQYNTDYSQWIKDAKQWVKEVKGQAVRGKPPEVPPFRG